MTNPERDYYRTQAQKRLRIVYDYARQDLEQGKGPEVYTICCITGIDLSKSFSVPESNMFSDIRAWCHGMRFYPEYPIGADVVDFVDPHNKVAIEIDGEGVHDATKDNEKNIRLKDYGYDVYRISSKFAKKNIEDILKDINDLKSHGKVDLAQKKELKLHKNSEIIVSNVATKYSKRSCEGKNSYDVIRMSDHIKTQEFKDRVNKYAPENIPQDIRTRINSIPLTKN